MSNTNLVTMDLDSFLGNAKSSSSSNLPNMPESDKITVVGILVDDSGSMVDSAADVISGVNQVLDALRAAKSADFYVNIHGFTGTYYTGMLRDLKETFGSKYYAAHGESPLIDTAIKNYKLMQEITDTYSSQGIPSTVAYLVMTDALPNGDMNYPTTFKDLIAQNPANLVVGMGITRSPSGAIEYQNLFSLMGITKMMTPSASGSEIRNAMNEFSRSVVSAAIVPY